MLKRTATFTFLSLAYAVILGHSIVPHHHDSTHESVIAHQAYHPNHDDDGLNNPFSHFFHSGDDAFYTVNHNFSNNFIRQLCVVAVASFDDFLFSPPLSRQAGFSPPPDPFAYISPHVLTSGLRAPPSFKA